MLALEVALCDDVDVTVDDVNVKVNDVNLTVDMTVDDVDVKVNDVNLTVDVTSHDVMVDVLIAHAQRRGPVDHAHRHMATWPAARLCVPSEEQSWNRCLVRH